MDMLEALKNSIKEASKMHPYKVRYEPETYSAYAEGWQDCLTFIDSMTGVLEEVENEFR